MPKIVHLTDNSEKELKKKDCFSDVIKIAGLGSLKNNPDLLVFPHSFSELKDGIDNLSILTIHDAKHDGEEYASLKVCTGNLMGFVGMNDTSVSIHSRFTHKKHDGDVDEKSQDFFLYYLLQKVFSINIFDLEHTQSKDDKVFDFLLFLFPVMLKNALSQGLFKEYKTNSYDDAKVKGCINISRFIRYDIPFKGTVSYSTHERSFDNSMTQLIRHTIEYIKRHPFGTSILNEDAEMTENVNIIIQATPTYNQRNRIQVLNANRRPKVHPYFTKYRDLQQLCVHILRHDALKYGKEKDKIHGILFDGAWLWEEYLNTILKKQRFNHAENKLKRGGLPMFAKADADKGIKHNNQTIYPDFYKENFILDAKYKHLNDGVGCEDLYQVVTYMYCSCAKHGGYIYPDEGNGVYHKHQLAGYNGFIHLLPFKVPQKSEKYEDFIKQIKEIEETIEQKIVEIDRQCLNSSPTPTTIKRCFHGYKP